MQFELWGYLIVIWRAGNGIRTRMSSQTADSKSAAYSSSAIPATKGPDGDSKPRQACSQLFAITATTSPIHMNGDRLARIVRRFIRFILAVTLFRVTKDDRLATPTTYTHVAHVWPFLSAVILIDGKYLLCEHTHAYCGGINRPPRDD